MYVGMLVGRSGRETDDGLGSFASEHLEDSVARGNSSEDVTFASFMMSRRRKKKDTVGIQEPLPSRRTEEQREARSATSVATDVH